METYQEPEPTNPPPETPPQGGASRAVGWPEALRVWAAIGLQSFGGPAGQIAVMHRILVDEKRWISERRFLHALNYCMLLPGPEATQLATYVGWLMHRTLGGIAAGVLFVLPGFLSILALSIAYAAFEGAGPVEAVFFGIKPAVLAIVVQAVVKIGRRVLKNGMMVAVAAAAFVAIFFYEIPFPLIVLTAGLLGFIGGRVRPDLFCVIEVDSPNDPTQAVPQTLIGDEVLEHTRPSAARAVRTLLIWGSLWLVPVAGLLLWLGPEHVFTKQATFFSTAAVVTFGGAYSVLAYIAQQAVENYGWLRPGEMLDGLGMAETTPGPLIQVVQFVGFMGASRDPGPLHPLVAGTLASVVVTWVTFVPCFLWIFLGAPYIEALRGNRLLSAALSTVTAAVVGVVLNLAAWFAIHTLFAEVAETTIAGARVFVPSAASLRLGALVIALLAAGLLFGARWGMLRVLLVCVLVGVAWWSLVGA